MLPAKCGTTVAGRRSSQGECDGFGTTALAKANPLAGITIAYGTEPPFHLGALIFMSQVARPAAGTRRMKGAPRRNNVSRPTRHS